MSISWLTRMRIKNIEKFDTYMISIDEKDSLFHSVAMAHKRHYIENRHKNISLDRDDYIARKKLSLEKQGIDSLEGMNKILIEEFKINIFYIDLVSEEIYSDNNIILYPSIPSIVLFMSDDHYDVCALMDDTGYLVTHFNTDHRFITYLKTNSLRL